MEIEYYKNLVEELNNATKAYDEGKPYMSDKEWDMLYYTVENYEKTHGYSLPNSPTQSISYEVVNELKKVEHSSPMLSLNKTKDLNDLNKFIGDRGCFLSLKLDGLTCRITYIKGRLIRAETRGNGIIGEDITHNARVIRGIPKRLSLPVNMVIDGEVICRSKDFESFAKEYKNSRNFAAGSLRLLDAFECAKRNLTFVCWNVVEGMEKDEAVCHTDKLINLTCYSKDFIIVPFRYTTKKIVDEALINELKQDAESRGYPIDGMVLKYDNIEYGESLGATAHHWRNGIAYKFFDESYPTILQDIEWSMGRTGVLTPVAIFDPIDIDGSIVERANLHNIEVLYETLHCPGWKGQKIEVYKANMIIPQISLAEENEDIPHISRTYFHWPKTCPICGGKTKMHKETNTTNLYCENPECEGKLINRLDHFCSKDKGLDIRGLSKATLEKLIEWGWVNCILDIFNLDSHKKEWINKPGFGATSVSKILAAIETSKTTTLNAFICSLGIPMIGRTISKQLLDIITSYEDLREKVNNQYDFSQHNGLGYEKSKSLLEFDYTEAGKLYQLMNIQKPVAEEKKETLDGLTFCITGKLSRVKNRDELVSIIEQNGGRFIKSVSKNVKYLINNDKLSTTAKNKEAQALGIPIISEEDFFEMI